MGIKKIIGLLILLLGIVGLILTGLMVWDSSISGIVPCNWACSCLDGVESYKGSVNSLLFSCIAELFLASLILIALSLMLTKTKRNLNK
jgi:hypothetical protein